MDVGPAVTLTLIPIAEACDLPPRPATAAGPLAQGPAAPAYKPASEDVLLALRLIDHPMVAASVMLTLRDALVLHTLEAIISIEAFAWRSTGLGALHALAENDLETAMRLLAIPARAREGASR